MTLPWEMIVGDEMCAGLLRGYVNMARRWRQGAMPRRWRLSGERRESYTQGRI